MIAVDQVRPPASADESSVLDWQAIGEEAVELLREYVRFPTVNDPQSLQPSDAPWRAGCEADAAAWLQQQCRRSGLQCDVFESAPGRVNVVARLVDGPVGRPIVLLSHSDVVPAVRREWTNGIDPFGGEIRDGYVYGRGVLDLKGLGIIQLLTLRLLQRVAASLTQSVVVVVAADEEAGGHFGAEWLLAQKPELAGAAAVLGEGAYSVARARGRPIHAIAVGEKGYLELALVVHGSSHHTSMPSREGAPQRLVEALGRVLRTDQPVRLTAVNRLLLRELARSGGAMHRWLARYPALLSRLAKHHAGQDHVIAAMLRDTMALTELSAGQKRNVVPGRATAVLSIRYLPDRSPDEVMRDVAQAIADPGISVEPLMQKPATVSPLMNRTFETLARVAGRNGAAALPIVSPGASDARFWRARGVPCYGWLPFVIPAGDLHSVHGPDERVSIAAFVEGLALYYDAVLQLARTHDH